MAGALKSVSVLDQICQSGVIPVLVAHDLDRVGALGVALTAGGLPVAEVTLRTDAALDALRILTLNPDMLAGAGTVLTPEQVDQCYEAGARFIVTPGFSARVVDRCQELEDAWRGLPVVCGVHVGNRVRPCCRQGRVGRVSRSGAAAARGNSGEHHEGYREFHARIAFTNRA